MVIFLTSSLIGYGGIGDDEPVHILKDNGFSDRLKKYWRKDSALLVISANPADYENNDITARKLKSALTDDGFTIGETCILDDRTSDKAWDLIKRSDVIILSEGNASSQNMFFGEIGLKELLRGFPGIIISIGEGSVNLAENAYLYPSTDEEEKNPAYAKKKEGLGLTDISVIPHSLSLRKAVLNGKRLVDDIIFPDSLRRRFYFIDDGSYFIIDGDVTRFYGDGEVLENGIFSKIDMYVDESDWDAVMTGAYICVFGLDPVSQRIYPKFTGDFLKKYDVSVAKSKFFTAFMEDFANKVVVEKERASVLDECSPSVISEEIDALGNFSRVVHSEKGGYRRAFDLRIRRLEGGKGDICIIQDITEMIDRDWMTDVLSRTGFLRDAQKRISELDLEAGYSLIYTNIRGFKTINELFGEESGDAVIFMVRDQLIRVLEPIILGRLESDHFVLIVRDEFIKTKRLSRLSQMTYKNTYKAYDFSVTFGVYHINDSGVSIGLMVDRAKLAESNLRDSDNAMYLEYTDKMRNDYVNQMLLISDVGEAMDRKEFRAFYQPIVDTYTHKVVSAESLIRWRHHDLGMVSPGLFIPALEKSGKVSRVDLFMAEEVFGMLKCNAAEGQPIVPVSINLSRIDFYDPILLDKIREMLVSHSFPAGAAKIEITESAYANLERNALDFLDAMKEKNVKILLDDYGSGMSSLSTLESYEFDTIKLDIGFIRKIGQSPKAETIIRSTIGMAHAFGADVIAEGVENDQQLSFLADAGCDMIQGYYFYKPMPEEDFIDILNNPGKTEMMVTWGKD